ncbi:acyltransferase family protein [Sphingomonas alpina]|uniref:Acyltransferase n=1 Tax=Sphingomonas alpina TaxID=653931 RepID=A0A7H0LD22_9SPHN|nr:acyltransferase [Sphingomonas alpina]QNQ07575.1 acyltransferase [Sphingomonas alpina]
MNARPELRALTSMRGIAAWFVVLYHIRLSIAGLPSEWVAFLAKGYLAVDFFFLLSGFVIWLSWSETLRDRGFAAVPGFLRKRVARIWPLHLFMLACAVGLALLFAVTGRQDDVNYPFRELPLHIALIQNWGFTDQLSWNDPSWSISAELGAYLFFPFLTLAIDWRRIPSWAVLAAIGSLVVLLHAVMVRGGALTLGTDITRFGLIRCLTEFTAGTAICALWLRWKAHPVTPAAISVLIIVAIALSWWSGLPETLAAPALFAALLLTLALTSGMRHNPLDKGALHYLGEISYATYLGHFLLFVAFKLVFVDDPHAVSPALIGLFLMLVLASSVALYHLVERPAQRWVNSLALLPDTERRATRRWRGASSSTTPAALPLHHAGPPPRIREE